MSNNNNNKNNNNNNNKNNNNNNKNNNKNHNKKPCDNKNQASPTLIDQLLRSKKLELVTAALLLAGDLQVDALELDRLGGVRLSIIGKFKTCDNNKRIQELTSFLSRNKDMTLDEILSAFKKHMDNK